MCTLYSKSVQYSGERLVDWWGYKRGLSHSALFGTRRFDYSTLWFSSSCLTIAYLWKQFQAAFLRLLVRYSISKIEMFFFVLCCKICGVRVHSTMPYNKLSPTRLSCTAHCTLSLNKLSQTPHRPEIHWARLHIVMYIRYKLRQTSHCHLVRRVMHTSHWHAQYNNK